MGDGSWTTDTYHARAAARAASGMSAFDYSDRMLSTTPRSSWRAHETLDPQAINNNGPFAGTNVRESADSDEHPDSVAIAILFDVTASMRNVPRVLQQKLPALHGLLLDRGYVTDPQILFGAIGDAHSDAIPLQVSQFESDNRMDAHLENITLEGGGGGQGRESYELGAYFMARKSEIDCLSQRGKKGYLFLMGDELPYDAVRKGQVNDIIGDGLEADIPTADIMAELQEKYEVFFLFVTEGGYSADAVLPTWRRLLGDHALVLDDATAVCETIALTIGLMEGTTTYEDALDDLVQAATTEEAARAARAAGRALAGLAAKTPATAAIVEGALPNLTSSAATGGSIRL